MVGTVETVFCTHSMPKDMGGNRNNTTKHAIQSRGSGGDYNWSKAKLKITEGKSAKLNHHQQIEPSFVHISSSRV
jgi:hypothetical protein